MYASPAEEIETFAGRAKALIDYSAAVTFLAGLRTSVLADADQALELRIAALTREKAEPGAEGSNKDTWLSEKWRQ